MAASPRLWLKAATICVLESAVACRPTPDRDSYVQHGLLAQVSGFGGCAAMEDTRVLDQSFFSAITLIQGSCTLEHGGVANPVVGVDETGMVFVLDSPSSFAFMIRTNRPVVPEADVVAYARMSLGLMGILGADDTLIQPEGVPQALLDSLGLVAPQLNRTEVGRKLGTGLEVGVTTLGPSTLATALLLVYPSTGEVRVIETKQWARM